MALKTIPISNKPSFLFYSNYLNMSSSPATERILMDVKAKMGVAPQLEEGYKNMLHMRNPAGGWREWMILTYDHSVIGDLLVKEQEELKKMIEDLEKKINMLPYSFMAGGQYMQMHVRSALQELGGEENAQEEGNTL